MVVSFKLTISCSYGLEKDKDKVDCFIEILIFDEAGIFECKTPVNIESMEDILVLQLMTSFKIIFFLGWLTFKIFLTLELNN